MELHNLMEYEVKYTLNHILETTEDVKCSCELC